MWNTMVSCKGKPLILALFLCLVPTRVPAQALDSRIGSAVVVPSAGIATNIPLMFIENMGQFDDRAAFQVLGAGAGIYLSDSAIWFTLHGYHTSPAPSRTVFSAKEFTDMSGWAQLQGSVNLRMSFVGANPRPRLEPLGLPATRISYFIGKDPAAWRTEVPAWTGVRYVDLYPGVDLEVTGTGGQWNWRLVCSTDCRSSLRKVRLRVEGAQELALAGNTLRFSTPFGDYGVPLLQVCGSAVPRSHTPALIGNEVDYPIALGVSEVRSRSPDSHSNAYELNYSTFLGGSDDDAPLEELDGYEQGWAIAVDRAGHAFVAGSTSSSDFPSTAGAISPGQAGNLDAFVAKVNPDGTGLDYAILLGGSGEEMGFGIAVDETGSVYVTGSTWSPDFPTTAGAWGARYNGENDAFVAKIDASGTELIYSTFLGGEDVDRGYAITVDKAGDAYVTGRTASSGFPVTAGSFATSYHGSFDAFLAKLSTDGARLVYATLLGGTSFDWGKAVAVDEGGNAYVSGETGSSDFPVTTAEPAMSAGDGTFVAKVNAGGRELAYAVVLAGDPGRAIAVDAAGSVYVTGDTSFPDFPATNECQDDVYVAKINPSGDDLDYAICLGGSRTDEGYAIAVDREGSAFVTGRTNSADFPVSTGAIDTSCGADGNCDRPLEPHFFYDIFLAKVDPEGAGLAYATFIGGSGPDYGTAIAVDEAGSVYLTGLTGSSDFPITPGAFDPNPGGYTEAFVCRLTVPGAILAEPVGTELPSTAIPSPTAPGPHPATASSSAVAQPPSAVEPLADTATPSLPQIAGVVLLFVGVGSLLGVVGWLGISVLRGNRASRAKYSGEAFGTGPRSLSQEPSASPSAISAERLLRQGIAQVNAGGLSEGSATLRRVLELSPDSAEAWLWLGWATARQGDRRTAEHCFLQARRLGHWQADDALEWLKRR